MSSWKEVNRLSNAIATASGTITGTLTATSNFPPEQQLRFIRQEMQEVSDRLREAIHINRE